MYSKDIRTPSNRKYTPVSITYQAAARLADFITIEDVTPIHRAMIQSALDILNRFDPSLLAKIDVPLAISIVDDQNFNAVVQHAYARPAERNETDLMLLLTQSHKSANAFLIMKDEQDITTADVLLTITHHLIARKLFPFMQTVRNQYSDGPPTMQRRSLSTGSDSQDILRQKKLILGMLNDKALSLDITSPEVAAELREWLRKTQGARLAKVNNFYEAVNQQAQIYLRRFGNASLEEKLGYKRMLADEVSERARLQATFSDAIRILSDLDKIDPRDSVKLALYSDIAAAVWGNIFVDSEGASARFPFITKATDRGQERLVAPVLAKKIRERREQGLRTSVRDIGISVGFSPLLLAQALERQQVGLAGWVDYIGTDTVLDRLSLVSLDRGDLEGIFDAQGNLLWIRKNSSEGRRSSIPKLAKDEDRSRLEEQHRRSPGTMFNKYSTLYKELAGRLFRSIRYEKLDLLEDFTSQNEDFILLLNVFQTHIPETRKAEVLKRLFSSLNPDLGILLVAEATGNPRLKEEMRSVGIGASQVFQRRDKEVYFIQEVSRSVSQEAEAFFQELAQFADSEISDILKKYRGAADPSKRQQLLDVVLPKDVAFPREYLTGDTIFVEDAASYRSSSDDAQRILKTIMNHRSLIAGVGLQKVEEEQLREEKVRLEHALSLLRQNPLPQGISADRAQEFLGYLQVWLSQLEKEIKDHQKPEEFNLSTENLVAGIEVKKLNLNREPFGPTYRVGTIDEGRKIVILEGQEKAYSIERILRDFIGINPSAARLAEKINVNTASSDELSKALRDVLINPGPGDIERIAARIISERSSHPFVSGNDLVRRVKGIGRSTMYVLSQKLKFSALEIRILPAYFALNGHGDNLEEGVRSGLILPIQISELDNSTGQETLADLAILKSSAETKKFSNRATMEAVFDFLQKEDNKRLLTVVSSAVSRPVTIEELNPMVDILPVKYGMAENIYQLVVRLKEIAEPVILAIHAPRDSEADALSLRDAKNLTALARVTPKYAPHSCGIGTGRSSSGQELWIHANQWLLDSMEAHLNTELNGERFILWNTEDGKRQDILIKDTETMRAMAKQIYKILTVYNELNLNSVMISAGDFVFTREGDDYRAHLITARNLSERPVISFVQEEGAKGQFVVIELGSYLTTLLSFRERDEYQSSGGVNMSLEPNLRIADFETVLEGFYEGALERIQLDGAPEDALPGFKGLLLKYILGYLDTRSATNNSYIQSNRAEISKAITQFLEKNKLEEVDEEEEITFISRAHEATGETGELVIGSSLFEVREEKGELVIRSLGKEILRTRNVRMVTNPSQLAVKVTLSMSDFKIALDGIFSAIDEAQISDTLDETRAVEEIDVQGFDETALSILIEYLVHAHHQPWAKHAKFLLLNGGENLKVPEGQDYIVTSEDALGEYMTVTHRVFNTIPDGQFRANMRHLFMKRLQPGEIPNLGMIRASLSLARVEALQGPDYDQVVDFMTRLTSQEMDKNTFKDVTEKPESVSSETLNLYALPAAARLAVHQLIQGARLAFQMIRQAA